MRRALQLGVISALTAAAAWSAEAQPRRSGPRGPADRATARQGTRVQGVDWVELRTASGRALPALGCAPEDAILATPVMYHHGKMVEGLGYERAAARGYDVAEFVKALCEAGYVALAPIRQAGSTSGDGVVEAGLAYFRREASAGPVRVFLIGFSRGGLFALDGALHHPEAVAGLVLMSPAPGEGVFTWDALARADHLRRLTMPVLVTLGAREPNREIVSNVKRFVSELEALGHPVTARLDYPGDHRWFHEIRAAYWTDIVAFLREHDSSARGLPSVTQMTRLALE